MDRLENLHSKDDNDPVGTVIKPMVEACVLYMNSFPKDIQKDSFILSLYISMLGSRANNIDEMLHLNKEYQKNFLEGVGIIDKEINK